MRTITKPWHCAHIVGKVLNSIIINLSSSQEITKSFHYYSTKQTKSVVHNPVHTFLIHAHTASILLTFARHKVGQKKKKKKWW